MAYEQKTKPTDESVIAFIEEIEKPSKKEDAYRLLDIFHEETGLEPILWGPSIIGYGSYHFRYATGHEGDAPLVGFSPRKAALSLYIAPSEEEREKYLSRLGKHKSGKACIYVNKLQDIDESVLREMIRRSVEVTRARYPE
ncbi:DUF1801 domain-containing protein [Chryseomicrobium sp. FSL W7-1435]|uniref:DUF1801 domain-containing protein n=1 Tax=Chryseomicrobium sp. FSL W7-1435 TaxID=2921704 RepID=UPI003159CFC4